MAHRLLLLGALLAIGCDSNVVDAVREPVPAPSPTTSSAPDPPSPLEVALVHRYSFAGTGSEVLDS